MQARAVRTFNDIYHVVPLRDFNPSHLDPASAPEDAPSTRDDHSGTPPRSNPIAPAAPAIITLRRITEPTYDSLTPRQPDTQRRSAHNLPGQGWVDLGTATSQAT